MNKISINKRVIPKAKNVPQRYYYIISYSSENFIHVFTHYSDTGIYNIRINENIN